MTNYKSKIDREGGQALIMLLFFVLVGVAVATAATFVVASNALAASNLTEGIIAKEMADSGIETGMLGIVRNNNNYSGEDINPIDGGSVHISVATNGSVKTIDSTATNGNFVKKVEVVVTYSNNVLGTPTSWKEIN